MNVRAVVYHERARALRASTHAFPACPCPLLKETRVSLNEPALRMRDVVFMRAHLFGRLPSVYCVVVPVVIGLDGVSFHVIVGTEDSTQAELKIPYLQH